MAPGKEQCIVLNVDVSSGSGSGTISKEWSIARRFRVVPPSETASYDVSVKDANATLILKRSSVVGTLSELQYLSLGIVSSVTIENGSVDGTYVVKFDMH